MQLYHLIHAAQRRTNNQYYIFKWNIFYIREKNVNFDINKVKLVPVLIWREF